MSTPKLYQYSACPFCWKVKTTLAFKKVGYETIEVNPMSNKEIEFSKDWDKVPIYIDSHGQQINDSTVIMRHIDKEFPQNPLFANSEEEKRWLEWSDEYAASLPPLIYRTWPESLKAFDYVTKSGKFSRTSALLAKYAGATAMTLVAKRLAKKQGIADPQANVKSKVDQWAQALGGNSFLGGQEPNGADAAVFGISMSVVKLPAGKLIQTHPAMGPWMQRMGQRTGEFF